MSTTIRWPTYLLPHARGQARHWALFSNTPPCVKDRQSGFSTAVVSRAEEQRRSSTSETAGGPLAGVRVLDLTRVLAGPFCTMLLGDLGAEVIKIEAPGQGDDTRHWGPPFVESSTPSLPEGGTGTSGSSVRESCYFLSINRNKKSVCVNLKNPKGREILRSLASKSDVLVENYLPGKLAEFGLGYEDLRRDNPALIYCSITGFGQKGPLSARPGYDVIAASVGGLLHITGPEDGPPCKVGVAMTDLATGLYAHGAIMAALLHRQSAGEGQHIDCNLLSSQVSLLVNLASNYINAGLESGRLGTAHASIVPYQSFQTKDGYFTVGCGNDAQFLDLCALLNRGDLAVDERFRTNESRVANRTILVEELTRVFRAKVNSEWGEIFSGPEPDRALAKFAFGPVNNMGQLFENPQVKFNQMCIEMAHGPLGKAIKQVGPAVKFSSIANEPRSPPPSLGQHTDSVLKKVLNLSDADVSKLKDSGCL